VRKFGSCGDCSEIHAGPHPKCPRCGSDETRRVRNYGRAVGIEWLCTERNCGCRWDDESAAELPKRAPGNRRSPGEPSAIEIDGRRLHVTYGYVTGRSQSKVATILEHSAAGAILGRAFGRTYGAARDKAIEDYRRRGLGQPAMKTKGKPRAHHT
jgi:hypothetical protein